ncbi:MAG: helix-turn-helix domain-containing protein [Clostridia bacterium]|nr:helix-turn-helix domain-containing protein [Clostridia bacterium]
MIPQKMIHREEKNRWYIADCFEEYNPVNLVRAFLHRDYTIGMHSHEFCEINIVINGSGGHYIEKMSMTVNAGDVFVIPSGIEHGYFSENSLNVYHILVKDEFFRRYREELDEIKGYKMMFDIEPFVRQTAGETQFLHLDYDELKKVENDIHKIIELDINREYVYQNVLTLGFICNLCERLSKRMSKFKTKPNREIMCVMEYIQNNLEEKLTVGMLSQFAGMSESTLNRQFKKTLKITPIEYVINCRIDKAKMLIEENNHSKSEIAQMCGFYDCSHMDKYIKKGL